MQLLLDTLALLRYSVPCRMKVGSTLLLLSTLHVWWLSLQVVVKRFSSGKTFCEVDGVSLVLLTHVNLGLAVLINNYCATSRKALSVPNYVQLANVVEPHPFNVQL